MTEIYIYKMILKLITNLFWLTQNKLILKCKNVRLKPWMKLQVLIRSSEKLNPQFQNFKNVIEKRWIKLASTNKLAQNELVSICSPCDRAYVMELVKLNQISIY